MTTINELLDRYIPNELPKLARRTQIDSLRHIEVLRAMWGDLNADALKPRTIGQYLNGDSDKGRHQRGKIVSVLKVVYKLAVGKWFVVETSPCTNIILPKAGVRTRYPTDAEFAAFRSVCGERLQVAMDIALLTGMRQGDLLTLRWENIDVNGRVIYVRAGKTGKLHGIAITEAVEEALVRAKRQKPALPRDYVIRTRHGEPFSSEGFRSLWNRKMKQAVASGLLAEGFRWHDIRSKTASDSADLGAASELLQHGDVRLTKRIYDRSVRIVQPLK
jgi:integrase